MTNRRRPTGFALLLVMAVFVGGLVLSLAYLSSASVRLASSKNLLMVERAKYLADSGLQHAAYVLQTDPATILAASEDDPMGPYKANETDDTYVFYGEPVAGRPDTYTLTAKGIAGEILQTSGMTVYSEGARYREVVTGLGPKAYWRLGERSGATCHDSMGSCDGDYFYVDLGRDGAIAADADTSVGFSGLGEFARVPAGALRLRADMSAVVWVKLDSLPWGDLLYRSILSCNRWGEQESENVLYQVAVDGDGDVIYKHECGNGQNQQCTFETDLTTNVWYQVVVTRDAAAKTVKLYIDGELIGTQGYGSNPTGGDEAVLYIGGGPAAFEIMMFHDGLLDEISIFDRVLASDEILSLKAASEGSGEFEILGLDR